MDETATIENERLQRLEEQRAQEEMAMEEEEAEAEDAENAVPKAEGEKNFFQKLPGHWIILGTALVFDIFALLPFVCVLFNAVFAAVLWLYFGPKKRVGDTQSEIVKIGIPAAISGIADFFIGVLPANLLTTLIRIAKS